LTIEHDDAIPAATRGAGSFGNEFIKRIHFGALHRWPPYAAIFTLSQLGIGQRVRFKPETTLTADVIATATPVAGNGFWLVNHCPSVVTSVYPFASRLLYRRVTCAGVDMQ
jgi:hypothetical protein